MMVGHPMPTSLKLPLVLVALSLINLEATTSGQTQANAIQQDERVWDLSKVEEKPRRLTPENPRYPARLLRDGIEGVVHTTFIVEPDGSVSDFQIQKTSDARFDAATRLCVLRWRFEPARVGGVPVRVRVAVPVVFKMGE